MPRDFDKCFTAQIILICQSSSPPFPSLPSSSFLSSLFLKVSLSLYGYSVIYKTIIHIYSLYLSIFLFYQPKCTLIPSHFHSHLSFCMLVRACTNMQARTLSLSYSSFLRYREKSNLLPCVTDLSCASSIIRALYWSRSGSLG